MFLVKYKWGRNFNETAAAGPFEYRENAERFAIHLASQLALLSCEIEECDDDDTLHDGT